MSAPEAALRVALIVDQFPEISETFISGEAHELQRQGVVVHIEALARAPHPDPVAGIGLDVRYVSEDGRAARLVALAWLTVRHPLRCAKDVLSRRRWAAEEHPLGLRVLAPAAHRLASAGTVHLHAHFAAGAGLTAMRLGALLDVPYSVVTHGYDLFKTPRNLAEKHRRAAFAVTPCEYSLRYLHERIGAAALRTHKIVVGVDGRAFVRRHDPPQDRSVAAVGRLVEKKGFADLVTAAAMLRDAGRPLGRVTLVGDGPLRDALSRQIAAADLDETFDLRGSRPPEEIRDVLESSDVLALPCVVAVDGDRDTMPVVVKEALAMEVPVVCTCEVGLPEVVADGWGRLCRPHDPAGLARALDDLLGLEPAERAAMGRAGREFVLRECSLARGTARLVELMGGPGPSRAQPPAAPSTRPRAWRPAGD